VDFIRRNRDQPFFLYVPHPQPHVPLFVSEKFRGKSQQGRYGDVIMELDWSVGQILQALRENGIDERTMVIFTSDNGPWLAYGNHAGSAAPLREGKGTVWEGGVREPCILRYPGLIPAGRSLDIPLMTIDLLPTLAALTGAELPTQKIDGRNALPLLRGESQTPPHDYLFFYYNRNELHAVRHREWKLYFPHTYRSMGDNPPGKNGLPGTYSHNTINSPELYNLLEDPSEKQDRARDFPNLVASISARADSMRLELGDRLMGLEGRENRPPGRVD
jgi:arylsulfatase